MSLIGDRSTDRAMDEAALAFARTLAAGAIGGGVVGLLVGGVLGRLAMRLLAVTSPPEAQGRLTDDLARVGEVTAGGTINLLVVTTAIGAIAGLIYLWVRRILPPALAGRTWLFAALCTSVGGAILVHDHPSFDYSVLRPEWLAVMLFVAVPALYGFMAPALIERLERTGSWVRRGPAALVPGLGSLALNVAVVVATLPVLVAFGIYLSPRMEKVWRGDAVTAAGRVLFGVLLVWGIYGLTADVISIATDAPSATPLNP